MMLQLVPTHWVGTDVGIARQLNEDAFLWLGPADTEGRGWLWLVADGQGGASAGDLASALLVTTFEDTWADALDQHRNVTEALRAVIAESVARIAGIERSFEALKGLCTAVAIVAFVDGRLWTAHVGDCRVSRVRDGRLEALTVDHVAVPGAAEIANRRFSNASEVQRLARVIGAGPVEPEIAEVTDLRVGDLLFVTTDGIHGVLDAPALAAHAALDPRHAVDAIVTAARDVWSDDNLTVAVIRFQDKPQASPELPPRTNVTALPGPGPSSPSERSGEPQIVEPAHTLSFSPDVLRNLSTPSAGPGAPAPVTSTERETDLARSPATTTLLFSRADLAAMEASATKTGLLAGRIVEAARAAVEPSPTPLRPGNGARVGVAQAGVGAALSAEKPPGERQVMRPAREPLPRESLDFDDDAPVRLEGPVSRRALRVAAVVLTGLVVFVALLIRLAGSPPQDPSAPVPEHGSQEEGSAPSPPGSPRE